jgi:hypothetical protein
MYQPPSLDSATVRRLAVRASCCEQTIRKVFEGRRVRGLAYYRARLVLEEFGFLPRKSPEVPPKLRALPPPGPPRGEP